MKKIFIALIAITIAGGAFYIATQNDSELPYEFVTVERGELTQGVNITGRVTPAESVDLAFEKPGRVNSIAVDVGSVVSPGQILAELENFELRAQLAQSEANVRAQQAKLQELRRGTRPEEVTLAQTKVSNAQEALTDAREELLLTQNKARTDLNALYVETVDIVRDAFLKAEDAVLTKTDGMFTDDNTNTPQLSFLVSDASFEAAAESDRLVAGNDIEKFQEDVNTLAMDDETLTQALTNSQSYLESVRNLLDSLTIAVNKATGVSQTTIASYKADINTAQTNTATALKNVRSYEQKIIQQKTANQSAITSAQTKVNTAEQALRQAQDELSLKLAGSTTEQIEAQQAAVEQAIAETDRIRALIEQARLRAPIAGTVTKKYISVGEIVSVNAPAFSLISESDLEIEANIPETDIARVSTGDPATVTLDAYTDDVVFAAQVVKIDPAETIIEGVSTYKTTFVFNEPDERIKPGMTANIDILTEQKENVIVIPLRAVNNSNGQKTVRVLRPDDTVEERVIKTGTRDSFGGIEILSGLQEGERVITFEREE